MSHNFKNNSAPKPIQKFCKVCQDAGKSESEYSSHFIRETREPNSKVTCPTLLALECRYCYKNGHTVKYCPILKEKDNDQKREQYSANRFETSAKVEPNTKKAPNNTFSCLDFDSDEEEKKVPKKSVTKVEVKEDFPVLCGPSKRVPGPIKNVPSLVTNNYASVLTAPAPVPVPVPVPKFVNFPINPLAEINTSITSSVKSAPWTESKTKLESRVNWAAWDSDSEEEEDLPSPTPVKYVADIYESDW
jgi:hypothetical protein